MNKRGGSSGGGQSSLGYLFGSDNKQKNEAAPPPSPTYMPPYGIDIADDKPPESSPPSKGSNNQGQSSGTSITGPRPSTKIKSAPGGDSSLGYLFGDKSN